jgi:hypothetical protein
MQSVKVLQTVPEVGGIFSLPGLQQVSVVAEEAQFEIFKRGLSILFRSIVSGEQGTVAGRMRIMAHDAAALNNRKVDGFASPEQTADVGYGYTVTHDGFIMTPEAECIGFIL